MPAHSVTYFRSENKKGNKSEPTLFRLALKHNLEEISHGHMKRLKNPKRSQTFQRKENFKCFDRFDFNE